MIPVGQMIREIRERNRDVAHAAEQRHLHRGPMIGLGARPSIAAKPEQAAIATVEEPALLGLFAQVIGSERLKRLSGHASVWTWTSPIAQGNRLEPGGRQ